MFMTTRVMQNNLDRQQRFDQSDRCFKSPPLSDTSRFFVSLFSLRLSFEYLAVNYSHDAHSSHFSNPVKTRTGSYSYFSKAVHRPFKTHAVCSGCHWLYGTHHRAIIAGVARTTRVRLRKSRPKRVNALIEICMGVSVANRRIRKDGYEWRNNATTSDGWPVRAASTCRF